MPSDQLAVAMILHHPSHDRASQWLQVDSIPKSHQNAPVQTEAKQRTARRKLSQTSQQSSKHKGTLRSTHKPHNTPPQRPPAPHNPERIHSHARTQEYAAITPCSSPHQRHRAKQDACIPACTPCPAVQRACWQECHAGRLHDALRRCRASSSPVRGEGHPHPALRPE